MSEQKEEGFIYSQTLVGPALFNFPVEKIPLRIQGLSFNILYRADLGVHPSLNRDVGTKQFKL